ncbi:RUN domain-containing protein, partial [Reticulomyxa filosa]
DNDNDNDNDNVNDEEERDIEEEEEQEEEEEEESKSKLKSKSKSTSTSNNSHIGKGFDYLLKLPMDTLSQETIEKLLEKEKQQKKELETLENTPINELWLRDLQALEDALDKFENEYNQELETARKQARNANATEEKEKKKEKEEEKKQIQIYLNLIPILHSISKILNKNL